MGLGSLQPGDRVGPYRIVRHAGEGGMGVVHVAEDDRLGRLVALKVLGKEASADPVARERLLREARAASKITHPHVAAVYDVGEIDGDVYLTMEYVEGESLSRRLARGPLPVPEVVRLGAEIAEALQEAHARGIVHRDIKPGNVLLAKNGAAKVVDFGLAMRLTAPLTETLPPDSVPDSTPESRLTRTGYTAGTVSYMSPEQAQGDAPDGRSDLFSLGVVLYEAAAGALPFTRSSPLATAAAILRDDPAPLRSLRPDAPPGLAEVVHRCLEKAPSKRPRSGADVAGALRLLEAGHATHAVRRALGTGRSPWPLALATIALAAVVLVLGIRFLPGPQTDAGPPIRDAEALRLYERSDVYRLRGASVTNLRDASALARRALEREPGNPFLEAHLANLLARLQLEDRDPAHTAEIDGLASSALAKDDSLAQAWFARGWAQLGEEDFEGAIASSREGRKAAPRDWQGPAIEGRALVRLGRGEEGLEVLRAGLGAEGGEIFTRAVLAHELMTLGRLDEAAAEFQKVLEYAPDLQAALNNLAAIYLMTGRYLDSIPLYQKILAEQPSATAASNLGTAFYYTDRLPEALRAYERAVELAPDLPDHKRNLGDALEASGDSNTARTWYVRALADCERMERDGTANTVSRIIGVLMLAKLGRNDEADKRIDTLVEAQPKDMFVQYASAQVHAMIGDRAETFDAVRRAMALGYPRELFRRDPYFGSLRQDREFLDLLVR